MKLALDTGSWEMWVNPNCTAAASKPVCMNNGNYMPNVSTRKTNLGADFDIRYGSGFASGVYWQDWLYLREMNIVIEQKFGVANNSEYVTSGILGLGYGIDINTDYLTPLDNLVRYNWIYAPIYAIDLGGQGDGFSMYPSAPIARKEGKRVLMFSGEIVFGGLNRYRYRGNLEPVPIWPAVKDQQAYWVQ